MEFYILMLYLTKQTEALRKPIINKLSANMVSAQSLFIIV